MFRRVFLRRLLHGLGLAALAEPLVTLAREPVVHADVPRLRLLFVRPSGEVVPTRFARWEDQLPGDSVCAVDAGTGEVECWTPAGHRYYQVRATPYRETFHPCTRTVSCPDGTVKPAQSCVEVYRPARRYPSLTAAADAGEPIALFLCTEWFAGRPA